MLSDSRRQELDLPPGAPALMVERVGYSATNHPLDVRRLYYRSDLFALRQEVIWGSAENRHRLTAPHDRPLTRSKRYNNVM